MEASTTSTWDQIRAFGHQWMLPLLVFMIPLHKHTLPPVIVACFLFHCVFARREDVQANIKAHLKWLLLPISIFVLHGVGLLYSDDIDTGLFKVQVKLSFLIFPIIFLLRPALTVDDLVRLVKAFILGCLASTLVGLGVSAFNYLETGDVSHFSYVWVTYFTHTSYIAMYINFGLLFLIYSCVRRNLLNWPKWVMVLLIVYFSFYILLLVSKTGLLMLVFTVLAMVILGMFKAGRKGLLALLLVGFVGVMFSTYYLFDFVKMRVDDFIWYFERGDWFDNSSMAVRAWTWATCWELALAEPFLGYGTGDVQNTLMVAYEQKGMQYHIDNNLNAHNQFFQTTLALGFVASSIWTIVGLAVARLWFKYRNWFACGFLGIVAVNFVTESMLETQAGNVFIAFFLTVFLVGSSVDLRKLTYEAHG